MYWPQLLFGLAHLSIGEAIIMESRNANSARAMFWPAIKAALIITLPQATACAIAIVALSKELSPANLIAAAIYSATYIPVMAAFTYLSAILQADLRLNAFNFARMGISALYALGIACLAGTGKLTATTAVAASIFSIVACTALVAYSTQPVSGPAPVVDNIRISTLTRRALPLHLSSALNNFNSQIDRLFVVLTLSTTSIGHYVVAWTAGSAIAGVAAQAIHSVAFPNIASVNSPDERYKLAMRALLLTGGICCGLGALSCTAMPFLLPAVFGKDYADSVECAQILTLGWIMVAIRQVASRIAKAVEINYQNIRAEAAFAALFVIIAIPFVAKPTPNIFATIFLFSNTLIGGMQVFYLRRSMMRRCTQSTASLPSE